MEELFYKNNSGHEYPTVDDDDDYEQYFDTGLGSCLNGHHTVDDLFQLFEPPPPASYDSRSNELNYNVVETSTMDHHHQQQQQHQHQQQMFGSSSSSAIDDDHEMMIFDMIKTKITSHPRYPNLVSAYLDCRKVGVPPETTSVHDHNGLYYCQTTDQIIGTDDPELDQFMELYCIFLQKYRDELSKPLDEATSFLIQIERQLSTLFNDSIAATTSTTATTTTTTASPHFPSDEATGSSEEQSCSVEAVEAASESQKVARISSSSTTTTNNAVHAEYGDQALKDMLLHKYSGYLSSLKKEFTKKTKKGKLPKEARMALLDWWKSHPRWPYPTEEEKSTLMEATGLDQKQITNWFINQRKRHWKPSEDQRFAVMDDITSDTLYSVIGHGNVTTDDI